MPNPSYKSQGERDEYRPDYFGPARTKEEAALRKIKGNFRRNFIRGVLQTDPLESIPPLW